MTIDACSEAVMLFFSVVIFDPAAFYGHHEYDLGIAHMFGGFSQDFYEAYHRKFPRTEGFRKRIAIYELFHHLNHWLVPL